MKTVRTLLGILVATFVCGSALAGDFVFPPSSLPFPLKSHVQRFLDSTQTRDYQQYPRTYRASPKPFKFNGRTNRFYGTMGNSYFAYTAESLTAGGYSMVRYAPRYNGSVEVPGELYLTPAALYDKFMPNSGWTTRLADGQQFLTDFDIDDRGYHYIAYSSFGWGILRDDGGGFALLWHNDPGSSQVLPSEQVCSGAYCPLAESIVAVTDGTNYYAIVGNGGNWGVWNTNDPTAPRFVAAWPFQYRIARDEGGSQIAAMNGSGNVKLIAVRDFVAGDHDGLNVGLGGSIYAATASEGYFWFLPYGGGSTFYRVTGTGLVKPYSVSGSTLNFFTAQAGAGFIVGVDGPTPTQLRLYRINPNDVEEATEVTSFMQSYYKDQNEQPSSVRHHGMLPIKYNGKTYLVWSMHGVGDVYEVSSGDTISISRTASASPGTPNPSSPTSGSGPYYGDLVTFNVAFNGTVAPSTIDWNFGNPESTSNTTTSGPNANVTHRYTGLTSSAAISATKTVSAVAVGRPELTDSEPLKLLVPIARVLVPVTNELVVSGKDLGKVLVGSSFMDASDGAVEGHQAGWTLNGGLETLQSPLTGFGVGSCGSQSLSFVARYDSFTSSISGITYSVYPFVAAAVVGTSNSSTVTFENTSSVGSTGLFAPGAQWVETWELLDATGNVLDSKNSAGAPSPLGTKTAFVVDKTVIPSSGGRVRLRLGIDASVAPAGCASYLTDEVEIQLAKPDPDIVTTQCASPTTAVGSCALSARSLSGQDLSQWSFQWFLDGEIAAVGSTYSPSFGTAGTHTVRLIASNLFGIGDDSETFDVQTPPCVGAPPTNSLTFVDTPIGTRSFEFAASAFGYTFQACDTFSWNFGDGQTGDGKTVQHTYAADGTYSVTLLVSNTNGSATVTRSITIGSGPPPVECADPSNKIFINYLGADSGCKPGLGSADCFVGEEVQFSIDTSGLVLASCHTYIWSFGDGTSATIANPKKIWTTAGTFNVNLGVSNGSQTGTDTKTVKTESAVPEDCGTEVPSGLTISWLGAASGCTPGSSIACTAEEQIIFFVVGDGSYELEGCEALAWNFGDGETAIGKEPRHTFPEIGGYTVTLDVTNAIGTYTTSKVFRIFDPSVPKPSVSISPGRVTIKAGETIFFTGSVQTGSEYPIVGLDWKIVRMNGGDTVVRTVSLEGGIGHTFDKAGDYRVEFTATNAGGVSTPAIALVTVTCGTSAPAGLTIDYVGTTSGCGPLNSIPCEEGEEFAFSIVGNGSFTLEGCEFVTWSFGDGETSDEPAPRHTYPGKGPYSVTLNVTNSVGAVDAAFVLRFFDPGIPKPEVTVTPTEAEIRVGDSLFFTGGVQSEAEVVGLTWRIFRTDAGNKLIRTAENEGGISHKFDTSGVYQVEFTATNDGGISDPAVAEITVKGAEESSFLIPVVARLEGNFGTQWRTDLHLFNTDPLVSPVELDFEFKGSRPTIKSVTLTSSTLIYKDFLAEIAKPGAPFNDAGPVIVRARSATPPQMWTRTYTVDSSGIGTYGQFIPAVSLDNSADSEGQQASYILPGLEISPRFRTNVGIVNPETTNVIVVVTARDDSELAFEIGSFEIVVPPLALVQIGDLSNRIPKLAEGAPFSLSLRPIGNRSIVVYGSMIDQRSNDPVYISGIRDVDQQGDDKKVQIVPGAGHLEQGNGTWRSDVVVYNDDVVPIHFDLEYFDGGGNRVAAALDQPLGPAAFVRVEDVLKWPELDNDPGNSFGLIRITTDETVNRYPIVFERTYKDRGEAGSFGQGIPAISPAEANVAEGRAAFVAGVSSDSATYTNLGLVAVGDQPSLVRVTLLDETTGGSLGTWQYVVNGEPAPIAPNASLIVTNIVRAINPTATKGSLMIEVVSGGDVWAYASVIAAPDPTCSCTKPEHTFDPEYIPAVPMPLP